MIESDVRVTVPVEVYAKWAVSYESNTTLVSTKTYARDARCAVVPQISCDINIQITNDGPSG